MAEVVKKEKKQRKRKGNYTRRPLGQTAVKPLGRPKVGGAERMPTLPGMLAPAPFLELLFRVQALPMVGLVFLPPLITGSRIAVLIVVLVIRFQGLRSKTDCGDP